MNGFSESMGLVVPHRKIGLARPPDTFGIHAYSHCNTFSSAAMAYAVTGENHYLQIIKNAYDFFQQTQCFATGGYGPAERILPMDGALGDSQIPSDRAHGVTRVAARARSRVAATRSCCAAIESDPRKQSRRP